MVGASSELQAFVEAARAYRTTGSDIAAQRMFRSVFSGVANDVSAALLTVQTPNEKFQDLLASTRVVLDASDREAVTKFAQRLSALRAESDADAVRRIFELPEYGPSSASSEETTQALHVPAAATP